MLFAMYSKSFQIRQAIIYWVLVILINNGSFPSSTLLKISIQNIYTAHVLKALLIGQRVHCYSLLIVMSLLRRSQAFLVVVHPFAVLLGVNQALEPTRCSGVWTVSFERSKFSPEC